MRTIIDIITALQGFPSTAPVRIGLTGPDGRRVVHDIQEIEVHESGIILVVGSDAASEAPPAGLAEADQTGEVIAVPPPPAVPGGLEGEGEEPAPPGPR